MAYVVETITEGYEDTPLTKFPVSEDTFPRMSDVSVTLLPIVLQYNQYISSGNKVAADQLIINNPDLYNCLHDAEKWNMIRDAIIAMQRFLLNKVDEFYTEIVHNAVGINDNPTEEQASVVSYSAAKVDEKIADVENDVKNISDQITNQFNNVNNTADADKSVKYATSAGNADKATTLNGLNTSVTELNYVDGVTSNIQTQLNGKQSTISGAASTITDWNLTANRALISDGYGKVVVSEITNTELGYLDGVTSNIQIQLNNKAVSGHTHNYAASSHNQGANTITEGTLAGKVLANASAASTVTSKQVRNIYAGTTKMVEKTDTLTTGDIYVYYE